MPNFQPMKDLVSTWTRSGPSTLGSSRTCSPRTRDEDHPTERRVSPEDMKKLSSPGRELRDVRDRATRSAPVVSVDPGVRRPAAIAYAYRFIEDVRDSKRRSAPRRSATTTCGCRALLPVLVLPQSNVDPHRRHHRGQAGDDRGRPHRRARPAPRAGRREDRQGHRDAARDRGHPRHGRPLPNIVGLIKGRPARHSYRPGRQDAARFLKPCRMSNEIRTSFETWRLRHLMNRHPGQTRIKARRKSGADAQVRLFPGLRRQRVVQGAVQLGRCSWPTSSASSWLS